MAQTNTKAHFSVYRNTIINPASQFKNQIQTLYNYMIKNKFPTQPQNFFKKKFICYTINPLLTNKFKGPILFPGFTYW